MSNFNIDDVTSYLDAISADQALMSRFVHQNPEFVRWCEIIADMKYHEKKSIVSDMPGAEDITALQVAIFDNWSLGQSGRFQYKFDIKIFTSDRIKNWTKPDWKATVTMWPTKEALKYAKKSKAKFSEATLDQIRSVQDEDGYIGVMMHSGHGCGSSYNDGHLLWAKIDGADTECIIISPELTCRLTAFDNRNATGKPLSNKVILQSRASNDDGLEAWSTEEIKPIG